jgi:hypothetical protein
MTEVVIWHTTEVRFLKLLRNLLERFWRDGWLIETAAILIVCGRSWNELHEQLNDVLWLWNNLIARYEFYTSLFMKVQDFCAVILCFWARVLLYFEGLHLFNLQCQAVLSCWFVSLYFFRLFSTLCPVTWCLIVVDLNFQLHFICNSWHDRKMKYCHFLNLHTMLSVAPFAKFWAKMCLKTQTYSCIWETLQGEGKHVSFFVSRCAS